MPYRLNNRIIFLLILLFLSVFTSRLFAAEYSHIYQFEKPQIITLSNDRQILEMKGTWQKDSIVGAPILPVKTSKIFIPPNEKVISIEIGYGTLQTIEGSYLIQHGTTPYPISSKGPVIVDKPNPNIYEKRGLYPTAVQKVRKPQFLRGAKIVLVDLIPVRYNPVEGQLKYYDMLEVTIRTEKQKKPDWVRPFRNIPKDREKILRTIDNQNDFLKQHPSSGRSETTDASTMTDEPSPTEGAREYVVITTQELMDAALSLTTHRQSPEGGGYTTHIEDIADIDANDIDYPGIDLAEEVRNFIIHMYQSYGTIYVVLLGDCDGAPGDNYIPTRGCYATVGSYTDNNIPSDLYFGCLDGSWNSDGDSLWGESTDGEVGGDIDWEPEVYIGRIAADNLTEAQNQIDKIIDFEIRERPNQTLLVGEKLDDSPTWGGDRMDWVYSYMDSTPNTKLYDKDGVWSKSQLLSHINLNQHHWINHLGHSNVTYNMKLSNGDVGSMTNTNYLLVYSQGCYSGSIDNRSTGGSYGTTDCFGEAITNSDRGAFAYIGNSRYGWYNSGSYVQGASNLAHKEFVEAVFTDHITKLGDANQRSKTDLDLTSGLYRWIAFETNLLGCPATDLKTSACTTDSDCDDGIYCNGNETCDTSNGFCQPGTPVNCNDDGEFCNGSEVCDEESDACSSTGDPCTQGTNCNENTNTCESLCGNGTCDNGENCDTCSIDCPSEPGGGTPGACWKYDGICHPKKETTACADCSPDYCCGDGFCDVGENSTDCEIDCGSSSCGNSNCEEGEDQCSCPNDCGYPPSSENSCSDRVDNDCDSLTDCNDPDCDLNPVCDCGAKKSPCTDNADCCSNKCIRGVCK